MTKTKKRCDKCGDWFNNIEPIKGKFLCKRCAVKYKHIIHTMAMPNLQDMLNKTRTIKVYGKNRTAVICVPHWLAGLKVKLVLAETEEKEK